MSPITDFDGQNYVWLNQIKINCWKVKNYLICFISYLNSDVVSKINIPNWFPTLYFLIPNWFPFNFWIFLIFGRLVPLNFRCINRRRVVSKANLVVSYFIFIHKSRFWGSFVFCVYSIEILFFIVERRWPKKNNGW